jgi:hypothetical protein
VAALLVEKGADLKIKNKRGQTPLAAAISAAQVRAVPVDPASAKLFQTTIDTLRKLGAAE